MAGRIEIDDVAPVVSGGRYPGQGRGRRGGAGHGDGVARGPRRRRGHAGRAVSRHRLSAAGEGARRRPAPQVEAVPIEEVVGRLPKVKRHQLLPMSPGRTPDVLPRPVHPRRRRVVDVPGGRLGRPARDVAQERHRQARRRPGRVGTVQRPAARCAAARARRDGRAAPGPLSADRGRGQAARARRSVRPGGRGARRRRSPTCCASIRCANWSPAASSTASGSIDRWPASAPGTRCSPARPVAGTARAIPCTARSPPRARRCPASRRWASTSSTCRRSTRSARCTARAATTA